MRQYEMMLLVDPAFEHGNKVKRDALILKLLKQDTEVKMGDITVWGKRALAYPIRKMNEAVYMIIKFEAERLSVGNIEKQSKLEPIVLRFVVRSGVK